MADLSVLRTKSYLDYYVQPFVMSNEKKIPVVGYQLSAETAWNYHKSA